MDLRSSPCVLLEKRPPIQRGLFHTQPTRDATAGRQVAQSHPASTPSAIRQAQGRPFRRAQGRPFRRAQGRPFRQAQGRPFRRAQGRQGQLKPIRPHRGQLQKIAVPTFRFFRVVGGPPPASEPKANPVGGEVAETRESDRSAAGFATRRSATPSAFARFGETSKGIGYGDGPSCSYWVQRCWKFI